MTAPNAELAWRVLDQIDAHPELWNQTKWIQKTDCGTTACFAGWACLLSGEREPFDFSVSRRAAELLGIEYDESGETDGHELFDGTNDRIALGWMVAEIFGPRPTGGAVVLVDHGPVKPPYGTPEREAYDRAQGGAS